ARAGAAAVLQEARLLVDRPPARVGGRVADQLPDLVRGRRHGPFVPKAVAPHRPLLGACGSTGPAAERITPPPGLPPPAASALATMPQGVHVEVHDVRSQVTILAISDRVEPL